MGIYSEVDIMEVFSNDNHYDVFDSDGDLDVLSMYGLLWPCVVEEAYMEAEEEGWEARFIEVYEGCVRSNIDKILNHLNYEEQKYTEQDVLDYMNKMIKG